MSRTLSLLAELRAHRAVLSDFIEIHPTIHRTGDLCARVVALHRLLAEVAAPLETDLGAAVRHTRSWRWFGHACRRMDAAQRRRHLAEGDAGLWSPLSFHPHSFVGRWVSSGAVGDVVQFEIRFRGPTLVHYPALAYPADL